MVFRPGPVPLTGALQLDPTQSTQSFLREQENRLNLPTGTLTNAVRRGGVPNTRTRMDHGFTLRTSNGRIVGAVFAVDMQQSRALDDEFEIDVNAHGEVADIVGQALTTRTMSVRRFDLYTDIMEEAFGTVELDMLTDQAGGFTLRTAWRSPAGVFAGGTRSYQYSPVWFESLGRSLNAEGDRVVRVDASLRWGRKQRLQ